MDTEPGRTIFNQHRLDRLRRSSMPAAEHPDEVAAGNLRRREFPR
jgi:hypothetical protein